MLLLNQTNSALFILISSTARCLIVTSIVSCSVTSLCLAQAESSTPTEKPPVSTSAKPASSQAETKDASRNATEVNASEPNAVAAIETPPGPINEPLVARVEMRLTLGEKTVDVIEKGDLLSVISERSDSYVVRTFNGQKGAVSKANAVRLAESIEIYNDLIKEKEKEGRLYTLRASAWWSLGETDKALADFDKAIELGYRESHAFASRGLFQAAIGNHEAAISDYTQAIQLNPKDSSALINRAAAYMSSQKPELAVADYSAALEIDPKSGVLLQQRAIAYKLSGKLKEALQDYDSALKLDEKDIAARMGRGFIYFQLKDHQAAVDNFSAVIELAPRTAVAYNNRGYNYQQLGKLKEALADYDQAIELAPKYELAWQNKAWLLVLSADKSLRDTKKAIEAATAACDLTAYGNVNDLLALAAALAADGQFDKAIGWQEKVVNLLPDEDKGFAQRILEKYQQKQQFDPKLLEEAEAGASSGSQSSDGKPSQAAAESANKS